MAQTGAEQLAKKMEGEVKRLAPQAVIRNDYSSYKDDGVDIYVYAPRKVADMLRGRLKGTMETELKRVIAEAFALAGREREFDLLAEKPESTRGLHEVAFVEGRDRDVAALVRPDKF